MRLHEAMRAIETIVNRTYGIGEPVGGYDAETFSADSEATATMKSALYSLTAVGVGVFIFNKYVQDKLPNKRDE